MTNKMLKRALEENRNKVKYIKFLTKTGKTYWIHGIEFDWHTRAVIHLKAYDEIKERKYDVQSIYLFIMDLKDTHEILVKDVSSHPERFFKIKNEFEIEESNNVTILVLKEDGEF